LHFRDSREPSPLAHEILNGRPYTFLDDAPLEERRTRAVRLSRGLPENPRDLAALDAEAIRRVREEAAPRPESADELSDLLAALILVRPDAALAEPFEALRTSGRALAAETSSGALWCAIERRPEVEALFPSARFTPDAVLPSEIEPPEREHAAREAVRGHLDVCGPVTVDELARSTLLPASLVRAALAELELEGFVLRGSFEPELAQAGEQFCARRLLARIHAYSRDRRRRAIDPVTAQDFVRFLVRWQHAQPESRREGKRGLLAVIEKLQGFEAAAGAWEGSLLATRVDGYRPEWLDELCLSGSVVWGRLRSGDGGAEPSAPSRATPITLALRPDLPWLALAARGEREPPSAAASTSPVIDALSRRGALFAADLARETGQTPGEIEQALWDGVARGLVTADGFSALRSLLASRGAASERRRLRRGASGVSGVLGRWALFETPPPDGDRDELAEAVAEQLLARWGIVFWDVTERETLGLRWREIVWALRRLEARGLVLGGRFVTGFVGEQYALPEALELLTSVRRAPRTGETLVLSACDPLNVVGTLVPGPRVPALRANEIALRDGLFVGDGSRSEIGASVSSAAG
jgi:ATP-dependent Lhr-like helicase